MDSFTSFSNSQFYSRNRRNYDTPKNFRNISPIVQNHIKQVYLVLSCAVVAAAVGAYLHILWNIGGFRATIASLGSIIWLLFTPPNEERKRVSLLLASSLFQGASIGPLIGLAIEVNPSIIFTALVGISLAFASFLAAALVARRLEYLCFGGLLSSALSIFMWLRFASSIFGDSPAFYEAELSVGLLGFAIHILYDTEDIIERAHFGDLDYVKDALTLFTDFAAIFVRILTIVVKNSAGKNSAEKNKRRRLNAGTYVARKRKNFRSERFGNANLAKTLRDVKRGNRMSEIFIMAFL